MDELQKCLREYDTTNSDKKGVEKNMNLDELLEKYELTLEELDFEVDGLSDEELENVAHQLSEQVRQLYTKLQEANMINIFKRLDYLFKVVEHSSKFDIEFLEKCISEIQEILTIPENKEETNEKEEEDNDEES